MATAPRKAHPLRARTRRQLTSLYLLALLVPSGCAASRREPSRAVQVDIAAPEPVKDDDADNDDELPAERPTRTPLTREDLIDLMLHRFPEQVAAGQLAIELPEELWSELEGELQAMGVESMEEFERLIPADFAEHATIEFDNEPNVLSLTRTILMLHDLRRYFEQAWQEHWHSVDPTDFSTLRAYGIDLGPALPAMNYAVGDVP